jgi:hypothetical protein
LAASSPPICRRFAAVWPPTFSMDVIFADFWTPFGRRLPYFRRKLRFAKPFEETRFFLPNNTRPLCGVEF